MKLSIVVDGRPMELALERGGGDTWRANGEEASVLEVERGIYSVLFGGRSFEARVERVENGIVVDIGPRRFQIEVHDPRRLTRRGSALDRGGRARVASPMPGKVVRVLVAEGEEVRAGQGLLIIEAMKMQNEMKAPKAGRVVSLMAREGAAVAAGEPLAAIE
jgi:biotin carboxyl carrier protein